MVLVSKLVIIATTVILNISVASKAIEQVNLDLEAQRKLLHMVGKISVYIVAFAY